jgi:hypothetical protein
VSMEAFLINPAHRRKRKVSRASKRRKRRGGLPSGLLSRMIRTYGPSRGMKEAWKSFRSGARNPWSDAPAAHRRASLKGWRKRRQQHHKSNPFGEEVLIVGANPRRKRRRVSRKRRHVRRNDPGPRRYHMSTRRRHRRARRNEPGRRIHRRHYRRNLPARSGAFSLSASKPMSLIMPIAVGAGGYFVSDYIPAAIGMSTSPMTRIGIKMGIAFGGGMVLSKFLGAKNGVAFALGAGINAVNDVLRTYVFKTTVAATTAGLGAFAPTGRLRGFGAMSPYSAVHSPYAS